MSEKEMTDPLEDEKKRARRLRVLVDLLTSTLYQDQSLSLEEARTMIRNARQAALKLFPGKERTFDMVLLPRFERILFERWGVGLDETVH